MFKGHNVLVTGGAGFIGSNLTDKLVEQEAQVIVLDDLFTGELSNIDLLERVTFVKGSVMDKELVDKLVSQVDLVFHLGARNMIVSTSHPEEDFRVNVGGVLNILLASKKHWVQRIIFTSSASVYGNALRFPINEEDHLSALNPYAASKLSGESYCMAFYESYGVPVTVLRYSNVYGIKQCPSNPYCGVISKFFDAQLRNEPLQIHGDGEQTRDFTYVGDVVDATLSAAISPKAEGEIFNVGTGKETSINELARLVAELAGNQKNCVHLNRRDIDNLRRRVLNIEKIRKDLRWIPTTPLEGGLRKTFEWLCSKEPLRHKANVRMARS